VARSVVALARREGIKVGLFRPVTLWPFPDVALQQICAHARGVLVVELSSGQMVEDVRLAVENRCPVRLHGRMGGAVPSPGEVLRVLRALVRETSPGQHVPKRARWSPPIAPDDVGETAETAPPTVSEDATDLAVLAAELWT